MRLSTRYGSVAGRILVALLLLAAAPAAPVLAAGDGAAGPAAAAGELRTVKLRVENMYCAACPFIVREALTSVEGVVRAEVDFESRTATVVFDPNKADVSDLTAATADFGYPSSPLPEGSS